MPQEGMALTKKMKKKAYVSSPKQMMHSTNTLEHALILLKGMVYEVVPMILISLKTNSSPH